MYRLSNVPSRPRRFNVVTLVAVTFVLSSANPTVLLLAAPFAADAGQSLTGTVDSARTQFLVGRYQDVVNELQPALARDPRNTEAHFWLGRAYFELHDYDRAIDSIRRSVELNPTSSDSHWWLGRAYGNKAERDRSFLAARRARQEFETAVQLNPSNVGARRDLLEFYVDAPGILGGGNDKALGQVDAIAAIEAIAGRLARAAYWALRRDVPKARDEYGAVLRMKPASIAAYFEAAEFYEKHPDIDALNAVLDTATQMDASDPRLLYYRGVAAVQSGGDPEGAERSLREYLKFPERSDWPSPAATHRWLGKLYDSLGRQRDAATEYAASGRSEKK
jgi:tetratricopeptide (TPR) repeat protein